MRFEPERLVSGKKGSAFIFFLFLLVAMLVGVFSFDYQEERAPAIIVLGVCFIWGMIWLRWLSKDDYQFDFFMKVFFFSMAIRLVISVYLHYTANFGDFAQDDYFYHVIGWRIAQKWHGKYLLDIRSGMTRFDPNVLGEVGFAYVVAFFYFIFGKVPMATKVFNCFVGSMMGIYFSKFCWEISSKEAGKITAWFCGLFPSMVLWSSLALKDPISGFFIIYTVYHFYLNSKKTNFLGILKIIFGLIIIGQMRGYMFHLVSGSLILSFLIKDPKNLARNYLLGFVIILGIFFTYQYFQFGKEYSDRTTFEDLHNYRQTLTGGNSAFHRDADISSPGKALVFLPVGMTYFLFAPFPWAVRGMRQMIALPEVLVWYLLFGFFIKGIVHAVKTNFQKFSFSITVMAIVTITYSLVEGNLGTAYRHRFQIMGFYLLFTAVGIGRFIFEKRKRKRRMPMSYSVREKKIN